MIKIFNIRRTLQRMEKYDYMKKSDYYKTQKQLLKRYDSATNRADKQYAKELIQKQIEFHSGSSTVLAQKKHAKSVIEAVNSRFGDTVLNYENISDFYDFSSKIKATMQDVFYDSDEVIVKSFSERVINKRMSVNKAIEQMRTEGIIL